MKSNTFTTTIIEAEEGNYLTQVADVELVDRIVATRIALGKYDSSDNYKEISEEEAEEIKLAQKNLIEAQINEAD